MKKGYHDYEPIEGKPEFVSKGRLPEYNRERRAEKLRKEEEAKKSNFVTDDMFTLQFGFTYPKAYVKTYKIDSVPYPKNQGSNGKMSRRHG
tara:strand:- start:381 stop:653 length:273 start_codon:yes stop_codon:yes gene_type:complete